MENIDLENFPTSESAKKMLGYVSGGFYDESYVGKWLYQVMGVEYDKALEIVKDLSAQFFPETATWGLIYHEIKWGLPVRLNLSYEERRRLIYLKRDYRAPMTPYRMEKYLEDATGFTVQIADANDPGEYGFNAPHPNFFKVFFVGEGTLDSKKVRGILDRLKQSHTTYMVNDRIEIVQDNRNLEKIILRNVHFKMDFCINFCIFFWSVRCFDGLWSLDGSVLLDAKRRYGLILNMRNRFGVRNEAENPRLQSLSMVWKQYIREAVSARVIYCYVVNFWRCRAKAALTVRSEVDLSGKETVGNATVETKTRDYWFLNGALSLDGTRNLNSIYRKEEVE